MKKIKLILSLIAISTLIFVSCKDQQNENSELELADSNAPQEHHGPHGHGDKKGPPQRNSPEQTKTLEEIGGYNIGDTATDFKLKNVDNTLFSLSDIKNAKGYIVTFTCNECPFSKLYEDRLIALHKTYESKGFSVVAINPNSPENEKEGFSAMKQRAEEKNFPFVYLVDEGQKVYPQYGAVRTPHVFLLDKDRKVQYIGTIDDNAREPENVKVKYLENAIDALLKNEKPEPNFTKAIGCPVKANKA
jgi:peroxiredoxin